MDRKTHWGGSAVLGASCASIFWPGAFIFALPGILGPYWQDQLHVGRAAIGRSLFFVLAGVGLFMFLTGRCQERYDLRLLAHLVHLGLCRGRRHFHGHPLNILRSGARPCLGRSDPDPHGFQCDQRPKQASQWIPLRSGGTKPHHDDRIPRRRVGLSSHELRASSLGLGDSGIHCGLRLRHPFRRLRPPP